MSVNSVTMFYGKLASDMMLHRAYTKAASEFTIKFAAERGYTFTEQDLLVAGQQFQDTAKQFGNDVRQLHQHHVSAVGKIASQAVGKAASQASGKAALKAANRTAGASPIQTAAAIEATMTSMELHQTLNRIAEIMGGMHGAKQASGGG